MFMIEINYNLLYHFQLCSSWYANMPENNNYRLQTSQSEFWIRLWLLQMLCFALEMSTVWIVYLFADRRPNPLFV